MRALPLWQPWASLVVAGVKRVETRPRPISTLVGERVLIHATLTREHVNRERVNAWPFREYDLSRTPFGALLGSVVVSRMERMTPLYCTWMREHHTREHALGDYAPGRYAFTLTDPRPFREPVPWKAKQGVFMVPDELLHEQYDCTCRVTGPEYSQTTTDPRCVFHGEHGTMVSRITLAGRS